MIKIQPRYAWFLDRRNNDAYIQVGWWPHNRRGCTTAVSSHISVPAARGILAGYSND